MFNACPGTVQSIRSRTRYNDRNTWRRDSPCPLRVPILRPCGSRRRTHERQVTADEARPAAPPAALTALDQGAGAQQPVPPEVDARQTEAPPAVVKSENRT